MPMKSKLETSASADKKTSSVPLYRNDLWTLEDDFSLGRAGDQAARMALEVEPPFTLGVTGKWGAGKTSVLRRAFATLGGQPIQQKRALTEPGEEGRDEQWELLSWDNAERREGLKQQGWSKEHFESTEGVFCVWFSPWQHQNEPNPLVPLVREIRAQFEARLSGWQKAKKTTEKIWEKNRSAGLASLKLLEQAGDAALSLAAGHSIFALRGTSDAVRQGWREGKNKDAALLSPGDGQRFHLLFEDAVEQVLHTLFGLPRNGRGRGGARELPSPEEYAPGSPRIILFIDDLDRCEEFVIVRMLEAIKLYLASRRCVFVLGLDDGAVLDALTRHWAGRSPDNNREYLEKLFQAILAVPLPSTPQVKKTVAEQLGAHGIRRPEPLAEDIEQLIEPNPRKIKNFVNGLCAAWGLHGAGERLWDKANSKVENPGNLTPDEEYQRAARRFLLFHYLRLYHRPVWRLLERQPWSLVILRAVIKGLPETERLNLPEGTDRDQQRLLWEFYFRAFSHVLGNPGGTGENERLLHGNESLDDAVRNFQERQDRKRSDEYLCRLFIELIPEEEDRLDDLYLYPNANSLITHSDAP
uniref:KAP family P-loop domain-containing protein n=1 Tax=Candidatus Kentrum sp. TC TaxID=2126339 RepID=A0A450Z0D8_9GAMM|nr:MAG: KAP family P-loop domain-containing protein [Candidatus Kentron sp. TC]